MNFCIHVRIAIWLSGVVESVRRFRFVRPAALLTGYLNPVYSKYFGDFRTRFIEFAIYLLRFHINPPSTTPPQRTALEDNLQVQFCNSRICSSLDNFMEKRTPSLFQRSTSMGRSCSSPTCWLRATLNRMLWSQIFMFVNRMGTGIDQRYKWMDRYPMKLKIYHITFPDDLCIHVRIAIRPGRWFVVRRFRFGRPAALLTGCLNPVYLKYLVDFQTRCTLSKTVLTPVPQ